MILPARLSDYSNPYVFIHEVWWHRVTNAEWDWNIDWQNNWWLSDYAKRELSLSFKDWEISLSHPHSSSFVWVDYFKNISERYARKKVVDFEMEDLWIKDYKDNFTDKHYTNLMQKYKETVLSISDWKYFEELKSKKLLSKNTMEFIETTKEDSETYKKIFNNIA